MEVTFILTSTTSFGFYTKFGILGN